MSEAGGAAPVVQLTDDDSAVSGTEDQLVLRSGSQEKDECKKSGIPGRLARDAVRDLGKHTSANLYNKLKFLNLGQLFKRKVV
jgi:hypothetical protein